jgi:hypothetical protein
MNERINELLKQSRTEYWTQYTPSYDYEKFAELIVRECASICEINGLSYKHSFTPAKAKLAESTSNHCAMMINKHFGVE